jgi:hypothetical protein
MMGCDITGVKPRNKMIVSSSFSVAIHSKLYNIISSLEKALWLILTSSGKGLRYQTSCLIEAKRQHDEGLFMFFPLG